MEGQRVPGRVEEDLIIRPGTSPLTARVRVLDAGFSRSKGQEYTKLVLRVILGGLMVLSGVIKLSFASDTTGFAFAIKGFKLGLPDHIVIDFAYMIPWTELLAGVCLIAGFFTRGAGLTVAAMMAFFAIGIASVMWRDLDVHCGCFGKLDFICTGPIGPCQITRCVVFGAVAGYLAKVGAGPWSLDRIRARRHLPAYRLV
jgi:uncharacterized membrane protein YphA (DoxX/SURF4 family)